MPIAKKSLYPEKKPSHPVSPVAIERAVRPGVGGWGGMKI